MKILFHNDSLNFRGVTNSTVDYVEYNQSILGNESTLIYKENLDIAGKDIHTQMAVVNALKKKYKVLSYSTPEELEKIASQYDVFYAQKAGNKISPFVQSTKSVVHAVFQYHEPHGDVYAYISEWLAKNVSNGTCPYVPYVVDLPPSDHRGGSYLRTRLGIPKNKFVFGRHGGLQTFDLRFVKRAIVNIVCQNKDIVFLLANTERFTDHPNVYFLDPFFGNQAKSNFISACDAMIHGRRLGESFGNAICEFLFHDKPVLAWEGGYDRNHVELLQRHNLLYTEHNVEQMMLDLPNRANHKYSDIVSEYTPKNVMSKFKEIFLS